MLGWAGGDSVLGLHPLEQTRLHRAPQAVAEVTVPEFAVVIDPSPEYGVISLGKYPQIGSRGPVDAPALDRLRDPAHCFHRRTRHTLAIQLPLEVLQGTHLEVIAEKGEARRSEISGASSITILRYR